MKAQGATQNWLDVIAARVNAPRFSAFLRGVDLILPNGDALNLKVQRVVKTPASKLFQVYPYAYITEMAGSSAHSSFAESGCGESANPLLAIQKSISEAVERCLFRSLKNASSGTVTTNGWATHFSRAKAESAALHELLERDAALVHALREIPFLEIDHESFPSWLLSWKKSEMQHTRFTRLRILLSTAGHLPTISIVFMDAAGFGVVAHGVANDLSAAILRTLAEAARLARIALSGYFSDTSECLFSNAPKISSFGPCEQAVAYAHHQPLPRWLFGEGISWNTAKSLWSKHFLNYRKNPISYEFVLVASDPLFTGYCKSNDVQDLFFGRTSDADRRGEINKRRLKTVKTGEGLSALPHFVA